MKPGEPLLSNLMPACTWRYDLETPSEAIVAEAEDRVFSAHYPDGLASDGRLIDDCDPDVRQVLYIETTAEHSFAHGHAVELGLLRIAVAACQTRKKKKLCRGCPFREGNVNSIEQEEKVLRLIAHARGLTDVEYEAIATASVSTLLPAYRKPKKSPKKDKKK